MRSFLVTAALIVAISIIYAAAAASGQTTIVVSADECAALVEHVPAADVAYRAGVDVDGNAVTPADLGGGTDIRLPSEFKIPITVDLQKKLGLPANANLFQTDNFQVGTVTWRDGRAYFNGQPLQNEEAARLSALCQERLRAAR